MVKALGPHSLTTKRDTLWPHEEYYSGDRDHEERKDGEGEHHWTGAESIEWYRGQFVRDTMHGLGDYRWRYSGPQGLFVTYEGRFHANRLHGYGTMSYPDGKTFTGIYHSNIRWGPGVENNPSLRENVGLWRGKQLARLAWRPAAPAVAPDFLTTFAGRQLVEQQRIVLAKRLETIGETNSAIDLLKQYGADPRWAAEKWSKLYPKTCTDLDSQLCYVDCFERDFFQGKIVSLEDVTSPVLKDNDDERREGSESQNPETFFAWNNNTMMTHMMKHCFRHEDERMMTRLNLHKILSGPRNHFRPADTHERNCRTLLMASYLGHTTNVAQLVNELAVYPDVADMQGNTALMYATCGDQADTMHFLAEAGANMNSYNDSCCTPLGVALLRYTCLQRDISVNAILQATIPQNPVAAPSEPPTTLDWFIIREQPAIEISLYAKNQSKSAMKPAKSTTAAVKEPIAKRKTEIAPLKVSEIREYESKISFSEDKRRFMTINQEYLIRINDLFSTPSDINPITYIFDITNMIEDVIAHEELPKFDKNVKNVKMPKKEQSKVMKDTMKPSKDALWQGNDKDEHMSLNSAEKIKIEALLRIQMTIMQLLVDGADPNLVKFPQPALLMAVRSRWPDLVRNIVRYGSDINERFSSALDYTALDAAISLPFSYENVEMIRALLECGAETNHRLHYHEVNHSTKTAADLDPVEVPGPTLFHAVLTRNTDNDFEEEIRRLVLLLLLEYSCDPSIQFKGRSGIDAAMTRKMELVNIFLNCPQVDINAAINTNNQSILVKMFSQQYFKSNSGADRFPILTNLLLYGADPLLKCQDGDNKYDNIFVFANKTLADMGQKSANTVKLDTTSSKLERKSKAKLNMKNNSKLDSKTKSKAKLEVKSKTDKSKVLSTKSIGKLAVDDIAEYKEAVDLISECARLLHIRWLQAKLAKDLIEIINKFSHRPWSMMLGEVKIKKTTSLWLTPQRCFEIWDILKTTKQKMFTDEKTLKHLLSIVLYCNRRSNIGFSRYPVTGSEKNMIDSDVKSLFKDYKVSSELVPDATWKAGYVTPELDGRANRKYNICFECALPFQNEKIVCSSCKIIAFCSLDCIRSNVDRTGCHPCSESLREKYFPPSEQSFRLSY